MEKSNNIKSIIIKVAVLAVILTAGWIAVFNIPGAVESFLPTVETVSLTPTQHHRIVSGTGVITQKDDGGWLVTVNIDERDIRQVKIGQTATLSGAAFDDGVYKASVFDIGALAVTQQGEYLQETVVEVILQIKNPDQGEQHGELRTGNSARVDIKTGESEQIHIVPYSAIMQDEVGEYVFILDGHSVLRRDIVTGAELSEGAQVLAGLTEKDLIIVYPDSVSENALAARPDAQDSEGNDD
ncbi:MAG: HlyD family efflux transporter periplasmic adaptor subunit [Oscillospiraceae bacterium]|nr:HlyD family efflux transporter periplasmic adaptor subunit [Oscillospiraceae bacterium]